MEKIILCFVFTLLLCGCQNSTKKENENVDTICSFDVLETKISYELEADSIDSDVSKLRFKTILSYDSFGIDRNSLKESDKIGIRKNLESQIGVSKDKVDIKFNENIEIIVSAEGSSVREYITDDDSSITFTSAIKQLEDKGATCK